MRYEGSNPSLCTRFTKGWLHVMDGPGSQQRVTLALVLMALAAVGVWVTMEPGMYRNLAWVLLGFFAFRTVMVRARAKLDEERNPQSERSPSDKLM